MSFRILLPLDGSPLSEAAVPFAARFARLRSGQVTILRSGRGDDEESNTAYLNQVAVLVAEEGLECTRVVSNENPENAILEAAEEHDLVVMSSHGQSGLGRWLLGSTTTRVIQGCRCPVLVVGGKALEAECDFRRIMIPLDGSEACLKALPVAQQVAAEHEAEVILFRALITSDLDHSLPTMAAAHEAEKAMAEEYLEQARQSVELEKVRCLAFGASPAQGIVEAVETEEVDLLVMTTHGRSGLVRFLCGSVTERVLQTAPCPVLVVNPGEL